jgi:hypothetical protein
MIVGDFNAKIGKEERNEGVAGKETIHDTTNDNGAKICDLAAATNTFIVSTQYRHKREHKITWMIPGGTEGNQIDHMLISKKWKRIIQDIQDIQRGKCRLRPSLGCRQNEDEGGQTNRRQ